MWLKQHHFFTVASSKHAAIFKKMQRSINQKPKFEEDSIFEEEYKCF